MGGVGDGMLAAMRLTYLTFMTLSYCSLGCLIFLLLAIWNRGAKRCFFIIFVKFFFRIRCLGRILLIDTFRHSATIIIEVNAPVHCSQYEMNGGCNEDCNDKPEENLQSYHGWVDLLNGMFTELRAQLLIWIEASIDPFRELLAINTLFKVVKHHLYLCERLDY